MTIYVVYKTVFDAMKPREEDLEPEVIHSTYDEKDARDRVLGMQLEAKEEYEVDAYDAPAGYTFKDDCGWTYGKVGILKIKL